MGVSPLNPATELQRRLRPFSEAILKTPLVSFPWKFTKASLYTFRYRPLNPLPLAPPSYRRSRLRNLRCTGNPLYRGRPGAKRLQRRMCPVQGIPCTGAKGAELSCTGNPLYRRLELPRALQEISRSMKNLSRGVQEVSKSDQLSFFSSKSLQERSKKLSRGFKKGYALIVVSRLLPASRIV